MAKVGSLNLIKQFSTAQGEDKQVCFLRYVTPFGIVSSVDCFSLYDCFSALGVHLNKRVASAVQERVDRSF